MRPREVVWLAQGPTATKWKSWDLNLKAWPLSQDGPPLSRAQRWMFQGLGHRNQSSDSIRMK